MAIIKIGNNAVPASAVTQHATDFDDNQIQTNLALLSFKAAVNGSLNKYNLQDNVVDEFNDNSGIDTSTSTNEALSGGAFAGVFSFDGAQTQIAQGTGTPIGDMTSGGGIANAFNGTSHPAASPILRCGSACHLRGQRRYDHGVQWRTRRLNLRRAQSTQQLHCWRDVV